MKIVWFFVIFVYYTVFVESRKRKKINRDAFKKLLQKALGIKEERVYLMQAKHEIGKNKKNDEVDQYADFMSNYYDDKYDTKDEAEVRRRYKIYLQSKERLNNIQKQSVKVNDKDFETKYGETLFMDMTDEEIYNMFHPEYSRNYDDNRRRLSVTHECDKWSGKKDLDNQKESLDVYHHCNHHVHDQGPHNSCWLFGAISQAECNYNYQQINSKVFSPQHILDCTDDSVGTSLYGGRAYKIIEWNQKKLSNESGAEIYANGYCGDYPYPYDGVDYIDGCMPCYDLHTPASCVELTDPYDHDRITRTANLYSLTFSMKITKDFLFLKGLDATFFGCDYEDDEPFNNNTIVGSHSMAIVGQYYGRFVKVKNSWSRQWGDNGFVWMDLDAITKSCKKSPMYIAMDYFGWENYPG